MNKPLLLIAVTALPLMTHAQGTVLFSNVDPTQVVNAPVYQSDGVTRLSGAQFMAELLAGPSSTDLASIATTSFLTGNGAGYFNGAEQTINSVVPGTLAEIVVRVWNTQSGAS